MYSMISYWLKYYRHEAGYTQQQIANQLKIERSTYTYYETGKTKPDINTLIKLAKIYNIKYTQLLEGIEDDIETIVNDSSSELYSTKGIKYRTHASSKFEEELLFRLRNLTPNQRREVMELVKKFNEENDHEEMDG